VTHLEAALATPLPKRAVSDIDLAVAIARMRGNERDKALLQRMTRRPLPPRPHDVNEATWDFYSRLGTAQLYAAMGRADEARRVLLQSEADAPRRGELRLPALTADYYLAYGWCALGDLDKVLELTATDVDLDLAYPILIVAFHDAGYSRQRDALLTRLTTRASRQADESEKSRLMATVARTRRRIGDLAGARSTALAMPLTYHRTDALRDLAKLYVAMGDEEAAAVDLEQAIDDAARMEHGGANDASFTAEIAAVAGLVGPAGAALSLAERAQAGAGNGWVDYAFWPRLARVAAALHDEPRFARLVARAEDVAHAQDTARSQAGAWMLLASAHARRGNDRAATEALRRAVAIAGPDENYAHSDTIHELSIAWIHAGKSELAIAEVRKLIKEPRDLSLLYEQIADHEARNGRFDAAWEAARQMTAWEHPRLAAYGRIAAAQVRAGDERGAGAAIERVQDPRDRATVCVAAAQRLVGPSCRGVLRVLDRR
jgi:tetratricopeptide (TPR) repeat protein